MEPLVFYLSYSRHVRNDPLGSTHQKFYLYKSLRTNDSLNKDKILHQRYLYFRLLILYKWINFIQMLFSGRHLNLLNHQRTAVAEFFTISCHSPLYPTSLTILAVPMWSVHSLNPASAGWQTLLRTVRRIRIGGSSRRSDAVRGSSWRECKNSSTLCLQE